MLVPVVQVRIVRMPVAQLAMVMHVGMRLAAVPATRVEATPEPDKPREGPGAGPIPNPHPPTGVEDGTGRAGQVCAEFVPGA